MSDEGIEVLVGKTLSEVERVGDERIYFSIKDGKRYVMLHHQDCCESVTIADVAGDLTDLIGAPILSASEETNKGEETRGGDSETWTFYKLSTIRGSVTIRWYGSSNGYYSESVYFEEAA